MTRLSAVVVTFNEERNIGRCLESLRAVADEIVVVDSFSTDNTEAICKQHNAKFIQRKWEGYSATKNFANNAASHDWILSIDADEALSEELRKSIVEVKLQDKPPACSFNRLTNYCGKWIRHAGWYPDVKVRIFDRRTASWQGSIHEELRFTTRPFPITHLEGDLLHYSYYTVDEHLKQTEKFTTLAAQSLFESGKRSNVFKLYTSPAAKFVQSYFLRLGVLDGYYGYKVSSISAYSNFLKYRKLMQLQKQ